MFQLIFRVLAEHTPKYGNEALSFILNTFLLPLYKKIFLYYNNFI